jgi:microcystin-dependent protein
MPDLTAGYTYNTTDKKSVTDGNLNSLVGSASINTGAVTNAKLATDAVTNIKVDASAAIEYSKLASLTDTYILVGNGSNVPTGVAVSGDVAITNAGVTAIQTDAVETAMIEDGAVTADKLAAGAASPTGAITQYAAATPPTGWLLCDGSAVSRTTYSALFAIISTTYGVGDGATTFNVPDLKGRVAAGVDDSAGRITSNNTLGASGGAEDHTLITAEIPAHTHSLDEVTSQGPGSQDSTHGSGDQYYSDATGSAGGGGAHNNLQPYLVLQYIVKT